MKDVFGQRLMNVYKEINNGAVVAAFTKKQAIEHLLTDCNLYTNEDDINLVILKKVAYANTTPHMW